MAYGKRDGFSYLDGIPVKLSEKVRAPRKITLPVHFHPNIPSDLLTEDYDFSLERKVLENAEFRRQAVEELAQAKVEKVASDIEDFTKISQSESEADLNDTMKHREEYSGTEETRNGFQAAVPLPHWQQSTNKILLPQPPLLNCDKSAAQSVVQRKELNLADFENETSPFDYMELQTINDLEELNTVFQGMAMASPTINEGTRSVSRSRGPSPQQDKEMALLVDARNAKVTYSSHNNISSAGGLDFPHTMNNGYSSLQQQVLYDLARYPIDVAGMTQGLPKLRSAKSVSDIHSSLEGSSGTQQIRSHTPPPSLTRPKSSIVAFEPESTVKHIQVTAGQQECTQPDPFCELTQEQQEFVSTLTDMGFQRARVSRGVKHLGVDYKKVVDYLCMVQSLEDAGYDGWDTEMALHLHNYSIDEAKSFLDLLVQFQDLGFDKDLARKALVRHKNDRDKALDALLT